MAKRITKLSKLSKAEVKELMKKLTSDELKPMHIKGIDGLMKKAVLFNMEDQEILVILDGESSSSKEAEMLEEEFDRMDDEFGDGNDDDDFDSSDNEESDGGDDED